MLYPGLRGVVDPVMPCETARLVAVRNLLVMSVILAFWLFVGTSSEGCEIWFWPAMMSPFSRPAAMW